MKLSESRVNWYSMITQDLFLEDKQSKEHIFDKWISRPEDHLENYRNFCNNFEIIKKRGLGMILGGSCGTGKTFAIDCIYNELKKDYLVCKTNLSHILTLLKKGFNDNSYNTTKLINDLLRLDLIILDDLGNEKIDKDWHSEMIFIIFDTLYRNKKSFIITTNLTNSELKTFLAINGSYKVFDRIREVAKPFNYNKLKNMRHKKNEELFKELI